MRHHFSAAALLIGAMAAPAAAQTVRVDSGDTLLGIALEMRPEDGGVSVQQVMLAIQALNPDAFGGGNINRLLSGVALRTPSLAQMRAIAPGEAAREVMRQNQIARDGAAAAAPEILPAPGSLAFIEAENEGLDRRIAELENRLERDEAAAERSARERDALRRRFAGLNATIEAALEEIARLDAQLTERRAAMARVAAAQEREREAARERAAAAERARQERGGREGFAAVTGRMGDNAQLLLLGIALASLLVFALWRRGRRAEAEAERRAAAADPPLGPADAAPGADGEAPAPRPPDGAAPDGPPEDGNYDEMAGKLELAWAYRKMGDLDAARAALRQVIEGGAEEQAAEARELLAALDRPAG